MILNYFGYLRAIFWQDTKVNWEKFVYIHIFNSHSNKSIKRFLLITHKNTAATHKELIITTITYLDKVIASIQKKNQITEKHNAILSNQVLLFIGSYLQIHNERVSFLPMNNYINSCTHKRYVQKHSFSFYNQISYTRKSMNLKRTKKNIQFLFIL